MDARSSTFAVSTVYRNNNTVEPLLSDQNLIFLLICQRSKTNWPAECDPEVKTCLNMHRFAIHQVVLEKLPNLKL